MSRELQKIKNPKGLLEFEFFTKEEVRVIENAVAGGLDIKETARLLGVEERLIKKHSARGRQLYEAMQLGKAKWENEVIGVMRDKILKDKDTTCLIFYLRTKMGWKEVSKKEIDMKGEIKLGPLLQQLDAKDLNDAIKTMEAEFTIEGKDDAKTG